VEEPARPSEQAVSRVGQVWEVDLNHTAFAEGAKDSITYVVLKADTFRHPHRAITGWLCLVLEDTPFEHAGELINRPDHTEWESQPTKYRRLV